MLVILEQGQTFDQVVIKQFLEKGVAIVQFCGRGTFTKDLQHFLAGSRHNFSNLFDDLQNTIEFIGNNMTKNISLYCKGEVSSLAGLWFNAYFPYLFNSSVLHVNIFSFRMDFMILTMCSRFNPVKISLERRYKTSKLLHFLTSKDSTFSRKDSECFILKVL